jgi:hypothetical protein
MKPSSIIQNAFYNRRQWIKYFNLMNDLFNESKIEIIRHARTISVGMACLRLRQTYGFSMVNIYTLVRGMYCAPAQLRLSELLDLSCYESFVDSLLAMEARLNPSIQQLETQLL